MLFLLLLRDNGHCWWKSWSVITSSVIAHSHTRISVSMTVRDFSVLACLSHPRIKLQSQIVHLCYMSRLVTKPTKWHVRPAKTQISLGIRPVRSESSLSAWRKLGSLTNIPNSKFIHFSGYTITYNYMRCNTISYTSSYPLNAQRRLWSDWADAQIYLSLGWAHSHFVGFVMRRLIYRCSGTTSATFILGLQLHWLAFCRNKIQFVENFRTFTVIFLYKNYSTRIWTESVSWQHQEKWNEHAFL